MSSDLDKVIEKIESNPTQEAKFMLIKDWLISTTLSFWYNTKFYGLENLERLSKDDSNVIAWRHLEKIDPFLALVPLVGYSKHEIHAYAKIEAFQGKGFKGALERAAVTFGESIPLDKKNPDEAFKKVEEAMKTSNLWLAIAPEGTRSASGALLPFRPGGISELIKYGAEKILPVSVNYNLSRPERKRLVYVNLGEPYEPKIKKEDIGIRDSVKISKELQGIMQKLNVITVDHVTSILFHQLAKKGISEIPNNLLETVYQSIFAIRENGYTVYPEVNNIQDLEPYCSATHSMLESVGLITDGKLNVGRTLLSFEDFMRDTNLNGVGNFKLKRGDLSALSTREVKKVARGYKPSNSIGYLVNNAGPEVVDIVKKV